MHRLIRSALIALACVAMASEGWAATDKTVDIGNHITLHYAEAGDGPTVVFVHGSLSEYSYWQGQVDAFAAHYHVIAYSRRYNRPNSNPYSAGYSAIVDSEDLAKLIAKLQLGKIYLVGHSYGALTGLFLASRHPELLRAAVLAEPPAMNLLLHAPPEQAAEGKRLYADVQQRMVSPMKQAFVQHNTEKGVATFLNYVFGDPHAWEHMSAADRADTLKAANEWEVMLPTGELFPPIDPEAVKRIAVPVLLMSGGRSYPFLHVIDAALVSELPNCQHRVFEDVGHQMWLLHPEEAQSATERFFAAHP